MLKNSAFLSSKTHWNLYCINTAEKSLDEDTKKNSTKVTQDKNTWSFY